MEPKFMLARRGKGRGIRLTRFGDDDHRAKRRRSRAVFAATIAVVSAIGVSESRAADQEPSYSVWEYAFYKTITYEFFSTAADIPLYYALLGGTGYGFLFNAANVVTAAGIYYAYEVAWNNYGPPITGQPGDVAVDIEARKTLIFRGVSTVRNFAIAYAFTGNAVASVSFTLVSSVVEGVIYVANEYGWYAYAPPPAVGEHAPPPDMTAAFTPSWPSAETLEVAAISVGATAGVIAANVATGGAATPVLAVGTPATLAVTSGAAYLSGLATTAVGALGGSYLAEWLYQP